MSHAKLYTPRYIPQTPWKEHRSARQVLNKAHTRLFFVCCSFVLVFLVIVIRLVDVMVLRHTGGNFIHAASATPRFRADIVDRNGELLVTSLKTSSLYANPRVVLNPQEAALKLSQVLPELNPERLCHRLGSRKGFVWLARHLPPQKQEEIMRLGLPGVYLQKDERRVYPHGELFSHIIGYTNIDNQGLGGIERAFNETLFTQETPLALSLDLRLQHVLRDELKAGVEKYHAEGAAGIIMDVQTGEILAMVSLPDFDPNHVGKKGPEEKALFNRLSLGVYEMGSSFKIFNTALYLERERSSLFQTFDVSAPLRLGRFKITDFHRAHYPLTVAEIFTTSSNIGAAKMAMHMGPAVQKDFFTNLGFLRAPSLEILELGAPLYPKQWGEATTITASYGYGIAITPLQLATAIGGIVNNGVMQRPTLLKATSQKTTAGKRVISPETSKIMRGLMYQVVAEGTGRKAYVEGYQVGGKTGTANTISGKSYRQGENMTSFVGIFPMSRPRYLVLVMIDRPKATEETYGFNAAGWNAAPVTGRVIERVAPLLQMVPLQEKGPSLPQKPGVFNAHLIHQEALLGSQKLFHATKHLAL